MAKTPVRRIFFGAASAALVSLACESSSHFAFNTEDGGPGKGIPTEAGAGAAGGNAGTGGSAAANGGSNAAGSSGGRQSVGGAAGSKSTQGGSVGAGGSNAGTGGGSMGTGGSSGVPPVKMPGTLSKCPAGFQTGMTAGHHTNFASGGQSRSFDIVLPPSSFSGPRPLLFAFHGTGLSGGAVISIYELQGWADAGFIVVAPDSNGNGWLWPVWDSFTSPTSPPPPNADVTLFDDLLACVAANHDVDAKRIYVAGQSAGGAMSNYMLGRRSSVLAGGVPESGAFDLTQPKPPEPIDPMIVVVTWGGDNDQYSGGAGSAGIANIGYAEQASLASAFWESQPGGSQLYCKGKELGHVWIPGLGPWLRDVLLAHPKGAANLAGWKMPPVPAGAPATCSEGVAVYTPPVTVNCATSSVKGCQAYCQMLGDCTVENGTIGPIATKQLSAIGFAPGADVCSGCVANCEADGKDGATDADVLSCLANAAPTIMCGPGFAGTAVLNTVGTCCKGKTGSKVCDRYCKAFKNGDLLSGYVTGCP